MSTLFSTTHTKKIKQTIFHEFKLSLCNYQNILKMIEENQPRLDFLFMSNEIPKKNYDFYKQSYEKLKVSLRPNTEQCPIIAQ